MSYPVSVPLIKIYSGDSFSQSYLFQSGDPLTPIDFVAEGWDNWKSQWRPIPGSTEYVDFVVDDSEAADGRIILTADGAATSAMGNGFLDLQASKDGQVRTWFTGQIIWREDVTR